MCLLFTLENDDASSHSSGRDSEEPDDPAYIQPTTPRIKDDPAYIQPTPPRVKDDPIRVPDRTSEARQNESNREYKHVTDFTRPAVIHTSVRAYCSLINSIFHIFTIFRVF